MQQEAAPQSTQQQQYERQLRDFQRAQRAERAATAKPSLARTAVLVRSHDPTPKMVDRIREWAISCVNAGVLFAVSVDVTQSAGQTAAATLREVL